MVKVLLLKLQLTRFRELPIRELGIREILTCLILLLKVVRNQVIDVVLGQLLGLR